jgi:hypothetical protein
MRKDDIDYHDGFINIEPCFYMGYIKRQNKRSRYGGILRYAEQIPPFISLCAIR